MRTLLDQLLAAGPAGPSVLDVDAARLPPPEPSGPVPAVPVRRLSAFDVADEDAETRLYLRTRVLATALASVLAVLAIAGSVALSF